MKLSYVTRVLSGVRLDKIRSCVDTVHERSGRNRLSVFLDMAACTLKYGAGYYDYMIFEFYRMNGKQRSTYMTRMKNKKLMVLLNDQEYAYIFDQKNEFYKRFRKYLGRDFLDLSACSPQELEAFLERRETVIAKPSEGECGKGIEKIRLDRFPDIKAARTHLLDPANGFGVVEEVITQHEKLNELYPHSINCFRMVTLLHEGEAHVLYAVLKTGNNGNFVDNLESGGFACHFDLEKGQISGPGHSSTTEVAEVHPATGVRFRGFRVPYVR